MGLNGRAVRGQPAESTERWVLRPQTDAYHDAKVREVIFFLNTTGMFCVCSIGVFGHVCGNMGSQEGLLEK